MCAFYHVGIFLSSIYPKTFDRFTDFDLGDELRTVRQPTLVLRGEHDVVVPAWLNRDLVALLPDARYEECPDVGHSVAIEDADWFAGRLCEHLDAE